jgi:hypothetical protein
MKKYVDFNASRPRLPHSSDYADLVLQTAQEQNMTGYHLTVVYKSASTLEWANVSLKIFMSRFYHDVISSNWERDSYIERIKPFFFLDVPGSRQGSSRQYELNAVDSFHHHIIILMERDLAEKRMPKWFEDKDEFELGELNRTTPARNHMLQPLQTLDDIQRCAGYAAKSAWRLNAKFEDAYLLPRDDTLLPRPVMLPQRASLN